MVVKTAWGEFMEEKPFSYQVINGVKKTVDVSFKILDLKNGIFTFSINEAYDERVELVIDPTLYWSTYEGGIGDDYIYGLATDQENNVIVVGWTNSQSFPVTSGSSDDTFNGGSYDAFVTKYDPNGVKLWSAFLGGSDVDQAYGVTCDNDDNIYITGQTTSTNFPVSTHAIQPANKGGNDIFLTKLDKNGGMQWSTYFGGSIHETGESLVVTRDNQLVLTGYTRSFDFPISPQAYQKTIGGNITELDAIVSSFDLSGNSLWSTYIGGSGEDRGEGINVDSKGDIVISGETLSNDFPVKNAAQSNYSGSYDIIVAKLTPDGKELLWSTYYGGHTYDISAESVGIDSQDNIILAGRSELVDGRHDFPITFEQFPLNHRGADVFILKLDEAGARLWSTFYGAHGLGTACWSLVVSECDKIWLSISELSDFGTTQPVTPNAFYSTQFKNNETFQSDIMMVCLSPDGYLDFASYYGGTMTDESWGIAVDQDQNIIVAGFTRSPQLPVKNASQQYYFDQNDGFVFKFKPDAGLTPLVTVKNVCDQKAEATLSGHSINSITWNWGDGTTTDSELSPVHRYQDPGVYTVSIDITGHCINSPITKTITIDPIPKAAFSSQSNCQNGVDFTFEGQDITSLLWTFEPNITTTETNPQYTFLKDGEYPVTLTAFNGVCFDQVSQPVLSQSIPKPPALPSSIVLCDGNPFEASVEIPEAATYLWQDGSTTPTYIIKQSGTYSVTVENTCGKITESISAQAYGTPSISLPSDFTLCNESSVTLDASYPGADYLWQDGSVGPIMTVTSPGTYNVQVSTPCGIAYAYIEVSDCDVLIPNVITPDDENGLNDFFYLSVVSGTAKLTIVDRWGKVVFHSDHYENNWNADGNSSGIYYYTLSIAEKTYKGWIDVIK